MKENNDFRFRFGFGRKKITFSAPVSFSAENVYTSFGRSLIVRETDCFDRVWSNNSRRCSNSILGSICVDLKMLGKL